MPSIFDTQGSARSIFDDEVGMPFEDPLQDSIFPPEQPAMSVFAQPGEIVEPAIASVGPVEAGFNKSQEMMWTGLGSVFEAAGADAEILVIRGSLPND